MTALPETSATVPQGEEGICQSENGSMTLIAKDKKADSEYTVAVTAKGKAYGDDAVYADQLISDAEGTAAIAFNMSSVSGDYTAIITDSDGVAEEFDFAYVNPAEFAQTAEKLDGATSAKEYEDIIKVDYQSLGISEKLFESVDLTQTAELLYNKVQDEKITLAETLWSDGVELAKKSFIIGAVANGSVDNLFVYSDELNLKEDKNWEWYTKEYVKENVQKAITTRQTGNYTTEDEFYEKLTESYVLSVVKSPDGVGNLKEVVQNFADEIGIKETSKDSTYRALVGIDFDTYKDLKDKFNELEKAGITSKPSGGGGGGGGSRGGSLSKEYATEMKPETVTEPIEKDIFEDIEDFGWAKQSIVYLAEKRIVTGKTKTEFCPDDSVTREEFAAMLVRAFAENAETAKVSFTDTEDGAWYIEYLGKAVQTGIIKGYDDGRFGIGETITRQDMAVMLNRAAEYAGVVLEAETGGETFSDDKEIADYAKEAVYALKKAGIINGVTVDSYAPLQSANRAQAAKVIFGLLNI